jgi:TRAP-type C4-dicarboxylate transport system substrate-binding protein
MKKSIFIMIAVTMIVVLTFMGCAPTTPQQTITLRFASYQPTNGAEYEADIWMIKEIASRTNGRVKVEGYWDNTLISQTEMLKGIQEGTADLGYVFVGFFPKQLALWSVGTPLLNGPTDLDKKVEIFWKLYEQVPELKGELAAANQTVLSIDQSGTVALISSKPITKFEDIKGLKFRSPVGYDAEKLVAAGANTITMPVAEVYSAFERGAFDGCWLTVPSIYKYKWHEIGKNMLILNQFTASNFLLTVNNNSWAKLPADIQQTLAKICRERELYHNKKVIELDESGTKAMKAAGVTFRDLSKDDVKKWSDLAEAKLAEKWAKDVDAAGKPGTKTMQTFRALIK